jgi:GNAT superfamily N-acetyltransferase
MKRNPDRNGPHDKLFKDTIAREQRYSRDDGAEETMLKIQMLMGGGVLNPTVEHGGDLLWRMTESGAWTEYGRHAVIDKVEKVSSWLTNAYGFEKEYRENVLENAKHRGISPQQLQAKLDKLLDKYADEHAKLPVYNRAQFAARKFSILIGQQKWKQVVQCGKILLSMASNRAGWLETAGSIDPKYATRSNPVKLPRFVPLPGFRSRPSGKKLRRNPLHPKTAAYLDALERIAGEKQVMYFGPFQIVGDRKGGILGKLELHFPQWGANNTPIVHIGYIGVDAANRGKGNGTKLMRMLIQAADEVGLDMDLDISPQKEYEDKKPPMNATQLHRFYSKFGFVSVSKSQKKKMRRTR